MNQILMFLFITAPIHRQLERSYESCQRIKFRYVLLHLLSGKEKVFHVSDIKPFVFDPMDIARRNHRNTLSIKFLVIVAT